MARLERTLAGKQPGVAATLEKAKVCLAPTTVLVVVTTTSKVYVLVSVSKMKNLSSADGSTTVVEESTTGFEGLMASASTPLTSGLLTTIADGCGSCSWS